MRERKIPTPGTIEFQRTGITRFYHADDPYGWLSASVAQILGRKEYLGSTVNFKTVKKSFKHKNSVMNDVEKQVVFENTHEAIIDAELWNVVQKIREQRHRPTRIGTQALFSGLLFCSECGSRLVAHRTVTEKTNYMCSKYINGRGQQKCVPQYIRENVLIELVLDNLREVISYARDYEDEFVRQIVNVTMAEQAKQHTLLKRQLDQQTRRIGEIDTIIQRLYEDSVNGTLSTERFTKMSAIYEQEQKNLESSTAELKQTISASENQEVNIKSFLKLVKSFTEPEELTPEILRMFIEKIVVHKPDHSTGERVQQIDIHYNFVGQFDMTTASAQTRKLTQAEKDELRHKRLAQRSAS